MANNSPFSSSSSISSILKGAQARQTAIQSFNDAEAANEWDNSSQTYDDYLVYAQYLRNQAQKTSDPMKQLTYVNKVESAHRSFFSNEVQRQTQTVMEGGQSNRQKYSNVVSLYYQAVDSGDYNAAQNLRSTLDSLSITIQNEDAAAASALASAAKSARSESATNIDNQLKDAVTQLRDNAKYAISQYQKLGPQKFKDAAGSDLFSMLANMVSSGDPSNPGLTEVYQQAAEATPDPSKLRAYQTEFNALVDGSKSIFKLPGAGEVTVKDIKDQLYANSIGEALYDTVQTGQGTTFKRNDVTGYQYGRDETGNYKMMPIYGQATAPVSQVKGNKGKNQNFSDVLKNNGFEVTGAGSSLLVRNNGEFNAAGVAQGQQVQLTLDAQGNLQIVNGDKQYNLTFDQKTGKYVGLQEQTPNPINLLPSGNQEFSRFNNRFFAANNVDPFTLVGGAVGLIDTTSPFARFMEPGTLLSHARAFQLQKAAALQAALPAPQAPAPAPQAPNYNVQNAPANAEISIAQPKPLPNIALAKPKPLPNLTVNTQPNTQTIGVSNAVDNRSIRF